MVNVNKYIGLPGTSLNSGNKVNRPSQPISFQVSEKKLTYLIQRFIIYIQSSDSSSCHDRSNATPINRSARWGKFAKWVHWFCKPFLDLKGQFTHKKHSLKVRCYRGLIRYPHNPAQVLTHVHALLGFQTSTDHRGNKLSFSFQQI